MFDRKRLKNQNGIQIGICLTDMQIANSYQDIKLACLTNMRLATGIVKKMLLDE